MTAVALTRPCKTFEGKPKAIDLFSGAGGISLGLVNAGFDVLLCSDIDDACAATHLRNFPDIPFIRRDVEKLSAQEIMDTTGVRPGELDLLIGGPPCQGFSIIGQRELWDPRNGLFRRFLTIERRLLASEAFAQQSARPSKYRGARKRRLARSGHLGM